MRTDAQMLGDLPDHVRFDALLKARPEADGKHRFIYLEASNESIDHAGEVTLQKALQESAEYYLRHGNVDLCHYTVLQGRSGVSNFLDYEIGRPVAVKVDKDATFVKAELFTGSSPQAVNANMVWESMTQQRPPMRWYPSVGGAVLAKAIAFEKGTGKRVPVITKVRWNNIALDRCPVNKTVGEASTMPVGVFAKSLGGALVLAKSGPMTVGYGTDAGAFTGARALNEQSLDRRLHSYWDFREDLAKAIQSGAIASATRSGLRQYAIKEMGVDERQAAGLVSRFLQDLRSMTKGNPA